MATSYVVVCSQLQLGYGLIAATIPCLKPFIAVYEGPKHPGTSYNCSYSNISDSELQAQIVQLRATQVC